MLCVYVKIVKEIITMEINLIEHFLAQCFQLVVQEHQLFVEFEKLIFLNFSKILLEFLNLIQIIILINYLSIFF